MHQDVLAELMKIRTERDWDEFCVSYPIECDTPMLQATRDNIFDRLAKYATTCELMGISVPVD